MNQVMTYESDVVLHPPHSRATLKQTFNDYLQVVKPGITLSNMFTAFTGLFVATKGDPGITLTLATLVGSSFVVMSGCALNNYIDRDIDQYMERTKGRALPNGRISEWSVIALGLLLGLIGVSVLSLFATMTSAYMALVGLFFYVIVYTGLTKRTTTLSTVIGGISGAMPPLIGWTAATGSVDTMGWVLFAILFIWQPPHFLALGMRRVKDYAAAGIPLLPVVYGFKPTKIQIVLWTAAILPVSIMPYVIGKDNLLYLVTAVILGGMWLVKGLRGFKTADDTAWASKMFKFSLIYLMVMCVAMMVGVLF